MGDSSAGDAASGPLPEVLARVRDEIDLATALKLADAFGGTVIYLPMKPTAKTRIARALGVTAAARLVGIFGYGQLLVPLGPSADHARKRKAIRDLLEAGHGPDAVALRLRCHVRTVYRVKGETAHRAGQSDLFTR